MIWSIVSGKRFDRKDSVQLARLDQLAEIFAGFGTDNVQTMVALYLPKWLMWRLPLMQQWKTYFQNIFAWFDDEYKQHELSFDPNCLRDFTDV